MKLWLLRRIPIKWIDRWFNWRCRRIDRNPHLGGKAERIRKLRDQHIRLRLLLAKRKPLSFRSAQSAHKSLYPEAYSPNGKLKPGVILDFNGQKLMDFKPEPQWPNHENRQSQ